MSHRLKLTQIGAHRSRIYPQEPNETLNRLQNSPSAAPAGGGCSRLEPLDSTPTTTPAASPPGSSLQQVSTTPSSCHSISLLVDGGSGRPLKAWSLAVVRGCRRGRGWRRAHRHPGKLFVVSVSDVIFLFLLQLLASLFALNGINCILNNQQDAW
jgi:hypothetical protein